MRGLSGQVTVCAGLSRSVCIRDRRDGSDSMVNVQMFNPKAVNLLLDQQESEVSRPIFLNRKIFDPSVGCQY